MSLGFHAYGVRWGADEIVWYLDGRAVFSAPTPADFHVPMYLIVNMAVGGGWPGSPGPDTPFPAEFRIRRISVRLPRDRLGRSHPMRPTHPVVLAPIAVILALCASDPARAAYRLDAGDVVEVSVLGVQDYRRRVTVDVDGAVALPLVGEVQAAGLAVGELRTRITEGLSAGKVIRDPNVTVELVEYRPFYVAGDVARPGAIAYRPKLTARVAVALAGGYDALRFRSENPLLMAPEIRGQYESAWVELLRRQARSLTLQAEADGRDVADLSALATAPVPRATILALSESEARDLKNPGRGFRPPEAVPGTRPGSGQGQRRGPGESAAQQQGVIVARQREAAGPDFGQLRQGRVAGHAGRGGESGAGRADVAAAGHDCRLVAARKERDETSRGVERLVEERRQRLLREGQGRPRRRRAPAQPSEGVRRAPALCRRDQAQVQRGGRGPDLVVHRRVDGVMRALPVAEDGEVLPGDVLDVSIRPDLSVFSPGQ